MPAIDNKLKTAKVKMIYIVLMGLIAALTVYVIFDHPQGMLKNVILGVICLLVVSNIFLLILKLNYIYVEVKNNKIIIRFYPSYPFFRKYKAFEIPLNTYVGFSVRSTLFGLSQGIIFYAKTPKKAISFPPVSISLLSKKELNIMTGMLRKYSENKK